MNGEEEGAVEGDVLGVTTLSGGPSAPAKRKAPALTPKSAPVEDDVPILIDPELPHLQAVLDKADIVIHILDARDPLAHRIPSLESSLLDKSKKVILLLHKIGASRSNIDCYLSREELTHLVPKISVPENRSLHGHPICALKYPHLHSSRLQHSFPRIARPSRVSRKRVSTTV
jgi:hypothetical protein